jgi:acylphosphatase
VTDDATTSAARGAAAREAAAPDSTAERLEATIRGRVQGVGFRHFVRIRASALGLVGWVSNEADGSVAVVAEGAREPLESLEKLLHDGPSGARVEDVSIRWQPARGGFERFGVRARGHTGD